MKNKNIVWIAFATALILLIPLAAMQFSDGWNWDLFDFIFAGVLLFGTGLAYELATRKGDTATYRTAVGVALATTFLLVWINGAVGIIGDDNPANLMYFGVLAIGFIGAIVARLKPRKMARVMFKTALVQIIAPVIALIFWKTNFTPAWRVYSV